MHVNQERVHSLISRWEQNWVNSNLFLSSLVGLAFLVLFKRFNCFCNGFHTVLLKNIEGRAHSSGEHSWLCPVQRQAKDTFHPSSYILMKSPSHNCNFSYMWRLCHLEKLKQPIFLLSYSGRSNLHSRILGRRKEILYWHVHSICRNCGEG